MDSAGKTGKEPDLKKCRTLRLVDGFCECVDNRTDCRYALQVGRAKCLCMHKDNYSFRVQYLNRISKKE